MIENNIINYEKQYVSSNTTISFKAYFYQLDNAQKSDCRLYIDIKQDGILKPRPDLILIMLNPGSCKPNELKYNDVVDVKPDQTLHRVKSLIEKIHAIDWLRVLNLSDLVNPDSSDFFKRLNEMTETSKQHHSIFDDTQFELLKTLISKDDRVYFACGVHPSTTPLMEKAKSQLEKIGATILNKPDSKYYHPLSRPKKDKSIIDWRQQIADVLQST